MTWSTIRDGAKANLADIEGLTAYDVMPTSIPAKDVAVVQQGEETFLQPSGHSSMVDVFFRVTVRVRRGSVVAAQDAIDGYIWPSGSTSIVAAMQSDPTLGGAVHDVHFLRVDAYRFIENAAGVWEADVVFRATTHA